MKPTQSSFLILAAPTAPPSASQALDPTLPGLVGVPV